MQRTLRAAAVILLSVPLAGTACADRETGARPPGPAPTSTSTVAPSPVPLTLEVAERQFRTYVTNEDVARSAGDERLALTWTADGQSQLTAADFRKAAFDGDPAQRFEYGKAKLYVPKLKPESFPQWFVVSVPRTVKGEEKSTRTALMGFVLQNASDRWRLSLTTLLAPKAKEPKMLLDGEGYATPLATVDDSVLIRPRDVPGIQATIASEGPGSVAAKVMKSGPVTTGYYRQTKAAKKKAKAKDQTLQIVYVATPFQYFSLRTEHGGGFVLYAMFRNSLGSVLDKVNDKPPIPAEAAHLLDGTVKGNTINMSATLQFGAYVPGRPKNDKSHPKADVVADAGAVTKASTPPVENP